MGTKDSTRGWRRQCSKPVLAVTHFLVPLNTSKNNNNTPATTFFILRSHVLSVRSSQTPWTSLKPGLSWLIFINIKRSMAPWLIFTRNKESKGSSVEGWLLVLKKDSLLGFITWCMRKWKVMVFTRWLQEWLRVCWPLRSLTPSNWSGPDYRPWDCMLSKKLKNIWS